MDQLTLSCGLRTWRRGGEESRRSLPSPPQVAAALPLARSDAFCRQPTSRRRRLGTGPKYLGEGEGEGEGRAVITVKVNTAMERLPDRFLSSLEVKKEEGC